MKCEWIAFGLAISLVSPVYAELPAPSRQPNGELVDAQQLVLSNAARSKLQKQLEGAVFRTFVKQPAMHALAEKGVIFDGACVAVTPDTVRDIIADSEFAELPSSEVSKKNSSFFNRGLERVSSPFHRSAETQPAWSSNRQFYLTTADWLTQGKSFEIEIFGQKVSARLDYRDEAQNVAVLSTAQNTRILPVSVLAADESIPGVVYLLLNPNSIYTSLTQHVLNVSQEYRYGSSNITARNGYPLFTSSGKLAGLAVSPDPSMTKASVVHPGILDRALHPQKYDRSTVEKVELTHDEK